MNAVVNNIKRHADPKLLIAIAVCLGASAALYFGFHGRFEAEADTTRQQTVVAEDELIALGEKLVDLRSRGVTQAAELAVRVNTLEQATPSQIDDLRVATTVGSAANATGVELEYITEDSEEVVHAAFGPLTPVGYTFSVVGTRETVVAFMQAAQRSEAYVLTYDALNFTPRSAADDGDPVDDGTALGGKLVSVTGTMLFWSAAPTSTSGEDAPDSTTPPESSDLPQP